MLRRYFVKGHAENELLPMRVLSMAGFDLCLVER